MSQSENANIHLLFLSKQAELHLIAFSDALHVNEADGFFSGEGVCYSTCLCYWEMLPIV